MPRTTGGRPSTSTCGPRSSTLGVAGLGVPETEGGSGGDLLDQVVVSEELGRAVAAVPFLASTVLGAGLASALGAQSDRPSLATRAATGDIRLAVALTGPGTGTRRDAVQLDDGTLRGRLPLVLEAAAADVVLVPVTDSGGTSVYAVPLDAEGVTTTDLPTLDRTRRLADITLDGASGELLGAPGCADEALAAARQSAQVILAADATGAAALALELSAEYAKVRQQFGTPIGTFQAVKHMAADMLVAVENARSATYFGAWEVAAGGADAEVAAAVAKGTATGTCRRDRRPRHPDPRRDRDHLGARSPPLAPAGED